LLAVNQMVNLVSQGKEAAVIVGDRRVGQFQRLGH